MGAFGPQAAGDDLVVGDQVTRSFHVHGPEGVTSVVRWNGSPLDLGDDEVRAWTNEAVADAPEADRPSVRARYADLPTPETKPAYDGFLPDPTGALWVGEYAARGEPARWDVFDAEGRWMGPVPMPAGFRLLEIGADEVVGVVRDDLDVEHLEVRALIRVAGR